MVIIMYRILHISDLHRSPDELIENESLLASLDLDFNNQRYEEPAIGAIDAIIVSGDIVQGVSLGETNFEEKLLQQYDTASCFLNALVDNYLNGDKKKIVIVPGNHDVNWNVAFSSMQPIDNTLLNGRGNLREYLDDPQNNYRFSYNKGELYKITDLAMYERRFDAYNDFYTNFYTGVNLMYEQDVNKHWNLFELNSGNIVVAAFNSCYRNDCFRDVGEIRNGAVAQAAIKIKDSGKPYLLKIAVWHHGISGPPEQSDHMNMETIYEMINLGFRLGIHGHQHRTEISIQSIGRPIDGSMALISAGSLCVGSRELPYGELRKYNIIELYDDYESARVHVRQMEQGKRFGPSGVKDFGGNTYGEIKWTPETMPDGTKIKESRTIKAKILLEAEGMLMHGKKEEAIQLLSTIHDLPQHGRKLLLSACEDVHDWEKITNHFSVPSSIEELVSLVRAYCNLRRYDEAKNYLEEYSSHLSMDSATKTDIFDRIQAKRAIHS